MLSGGQTIRPLEAAVQRHRLTREFSGSQGGENEDDIVPFSLVEICRRLRGVFCLHHQSDRSEIARRYISESCYLHSFYSLKSY
jgi:hypothetical protein